MKRRQFVSGGGTSMKRSQENKTQVYLYHSSANQTIPAGLLQLSAY